jgi:Protein of unknown function (DUF1592)/Protein of unknown function (DUF1588)/Protein of unknown function (DUF1595)
MPRPANASPLAAAALVASIASISGCYSGLHGDSGGQADDAGETGGSTAAGDSSGSDSGGDEPFQTSKFECDPTQVPTDVALRRLSRVQYVNAVHDLVAMLVPDDVDAVLAVAQQRIGLIPVDARSGPDPSYGGFSRLDQSIFQETVEGSYQVGATIGAAIVGDDARLGTAAGACATDADTSNDAACVDAFVRRFAPRALRRPLTDDDVAFYVDVVGDTIEREDYADILTVLLAAPGFLYFIESGQDGTAGPRVPLTAHEIAARLSFHFWQTIPDDALVAAADQGDLLEDASYAEQVERLFLDPRSAIAITEFYGEWLDPPHAGELDASVGMADYDAFLGGFVPTPETRTNMAAEVQQLGLHHTRDTAASFDEWFRSDRSFARTDDIASIYGVAVWDGSGEPPQLPDGREGLITRALMLASGSAMTHPVLKGVYARKTLLCDPVPPPPADAMTVAMGIDDAGLGARARAIAISEARADCAGCHTNVINPLGFVTEDFDGLGRHRDIERVFDKQTGEVIAEVPIDTSAVPRVDDPTDERTAATASELNALMLEGEKPQACFARRYFRFTFGREEDDVADGCTLATLHEALLAGEDLGVVVREIAMRPEFRSKLIEGGE